MSLALPLPLSRRLDGFPMECAGGHPFNGAGAIFRGVWSSSFDGKAPPSFESGFLVTPGLSLTGETN